MTKRKKVSVRKKITRRRNTFNNCNFKEENNMKDEQKWDVPINVGGITEEELWLSEFDGISNGYTGM